MDSKLDITAVLSNFDINKAKIKLNTTCLKCTSPEMEILAETWPTDKATEDATESGNYPLNRFDLVLLEYGFVQVQLNKRLMKHAWNFLCTPSLKRKEKLNMKNYQKLKHAMKRQCVP